MRSSERRKRPLGVLLACLLTAAVVPAGCGGSSPSGGHAGRRAGGAGGTRVIAAPSQLLAGTAPQPDGTLWVLAGTSRVRTIDEIDVGTGKPSASIGVSNTARALAQSSTGIVALGLGGVRTGAIELLSGSTDTPTSTISVGAPVISVAFGDDGVTLYALDGTAKTRSVTIINSSTDKVTGTMGLPSDARSIVPTPNQKAIWSVQASGTVQETSLTSRRPIESFFTGSPGIAAAVSPAGEVLYVLKGTSAMANIDAISTATEHVTQVLPAAANSIDLSTSLDGSQLYNFVGAPSYGNIQILDL